MCNVAGIKKPHPDRCGSAQQQQQQLLHVSTVRVSLVSNSLFHSPEPEAPSLIPELAPGIGPTVVREETEGRAP